MITLGVDAHKTVHAAVALDDAGREIATWRGPNSPDGWAELDARAVASVVWREAASSPPLQPEEQDETAVLDLLVSEREGALGEATRLRNQLHALLLQLDPQYKVHLPALTTPAGVAAAEAYTGPGRTPLQRAPAASVRRLAQRLRLATEQAADLARQIAARAQAGFSPLTRLKGINLLTAGALAGLLGPGCRF